MKKKIVGIITAMTMLISVMPQIIVNAAEDITISTAAELKSFADSVNAGNTYEGKTVSLTQDIDLSEICGADINGEEVSWTSIGTMENGFSGLFDGNGHKITNLYINGNGNGLFGFCYGIIEDLNVEGSVICAAADLYFAGGIAGGLLEGIIRRCSFSGSVEGDSHVGGIVGLNGGQITDCFNTGTVTALHCGGGIAGTNDGGSLIRCYNTGNIQKAASEYVTDFFGSITGGGDGSTITDCYYLEGTADDGAYMTSGDDTTTALTLEQFADKSNFVNWDFDTVWEMSAELGRPVLRSGNANKHIHKICGDENCTDNHEDIEWTAWDSADTLPTEAGNYYLTADVELNETWRPADGTNLCMNGHIIQQNSSVQYDHAISTGFKTALTITDCSDTVHKFTEGDNEKWVIDEQNGTKTLTGGVIICPYNTAIINLSANVNLYNINIAGSRTGINNGPYPLNIYGCTFKGNDEAVYAMGYLNMRDCTVSENASGVRTAENGILSVGGEIIISDNVDADGKKRNVYLDGHITDTYIHIASPLTENSKIGVSAQKRPLTDRSVAVTDANDIDYSKYFTSDDTDSYAGYTIENGEDNIIYLKAGTPTDFRIIDDGAGTILAAAPKAGTYTAILAEYSYSGIFTNLTAVPVTFDEACIKSVVEYNTPLEIRSTYIIKLMLWNSLDGMTPCCESDTVIKYSNFE